jgi:hypothetical protein
MLLATNVSLLEWVLLVTILACGGGVLWRTFGRGPRGEAGRDHSDPDAVQRAHSRAEDRIAHLEVRLHDFAREVEARMETRALQLDSLVVAGDREIVRLSTLLNQLHLNDGGGSSRQPDVMHFGSAAPASTGSASTSRSSVATVPAPQAEMAGHLNDAGYSVADIAQIIGQPADVIRNLLKKAA